RHEGKHGIDDFVNNHLSWLNAEQKAEIDKLKVEGNFPGIKARVNTFFEAATGETKVKATEELKGACKELYQEVLGEKADEVKALKESGASDSEVAKKIDEFIAALTDEAKKAKAEEYKADCKKIWGVQARKRRTHDHGNHDLEDYFKNHYKLYNKALEYYEAATGEVKEKAKELMQGGCRELIRVIVGHEKADKLIAMKESGASLKDMDNKLQEFIDEVSDAGKKTLADTYGPGCRKLFGVDSRKRRSHDHGEHKLEDYFKSHFSWLTDAQKDELRQMKTDGKKAPDFYAKALEYYDAATGETKEKAKELMQGGCRELIRVIVGNEKADELTAMKESGASVNDMDAKLQEFVGGVTEEYKKNLSGTYGPGCRRIFGVSSRMRREHDHGEHKLEDYFKSHFSWLNDAQKDELRQMKTDGKKAPEL
uniref:Polyprotein allergen nematode domain-containing protein n=1 Tax=Panagrolaimus sp. ES5 TaxID=591445 RepID=A0AC34GB01_9BILA